MITLTNKQRRHLRALGHHLDPVVRLGGSGLSEALIAKAEVELENHELIKIKAGDGALDPIAEAAGRLAEACGAAVVQVIGRTALLYRPRAKKPDIVLPA